MTEGIKWKRCPTEIEKQKENLFGQGSSALNGVVSEPYGIHLPKGMEDVVKKISNFEVRSDDIWIVTYPKCGTTLTQVQKSRP